MVNWILSKRDLHHSLFQLNLSFDTRYWKHRYKAIRQKCYLFERIETPFNIDLITFVDLIFRHKLLLEGKNKVDRKAGEMDIYRENIGNRFFIHKLGNRFLIVSNFPKKKFKISKIYKSGKKESKLFLGFINDEKFLVPFLAEIGQKLNVILFEPFLLQISENNLNVGLISNFSGNFDQIFDFDQLGENIDFPNVVDFGNHKNAKFRILPVLTRDQIPLENDEIEISVKIHLLKITELSVEIIFSKIVEKSIFEISDNSEPFGYLVLDFSVGLNFGVFGLKRLDPMAIENLPNYMFEISFENFTIKKVKLPESSVRIIGGWRRTTIVEKLYFTRNSTFFYIKESSKLLF